MCVSTLRLLYPVESAPVKEVLKEFFRLIGCIFCEVPVRSERDAEKELRECGGTEVDIVLNLDVFQWRAILPPRNSSVAVRVEKVLLKERENAVLLVDCAPPPNGEGEGTPKKDFYEDLLENLIQKIWAKGSEKAQLLEMKRLFFKRDLLGSLQCKRALCVVNMGETLELNLPSKTIRPQRYVGKILSTFNWFYCELGGQDFGGDWDETASVYVHYARINIARKIREVFAFLDEVPAFLEETEDCLLPMVTYCRADFLLAELGKLYRKEPRYFGTLFLAARVCQSEPSQELNAAFYYQQLFALLAGREQRVYSFVYYDYGRYMEKVKKERDLAIFYYTKANNLNPLCYRACFKLACYEARDRNSNAAKDLFGSVIRIIGGTYSGAMEPDRIVWKYLSLRCIQYLFKSYVWLWKIALASGEYSAAAIYLQQAEAVAEKYEENACLEEIYDQNSAEWKALKEYHKDSEPVQLLSSIVKNGFQMLMSGVPSKYQSQAD